MESADPRASLGSGLEKAREEGGQHHAQNDENPDREERVLDGPEPRIARAQSAPLCPVPWADSWHVGAGQDHRLIPSPTAPKCSVATSGESRGKRSNARCSDWVAPMRGQQWSRHLTLGSGGLFPIRCCVATSSIAWGTPVS